MLNIWCMIVYLDFALLKDFGFAQHFHGDAQSNSLRGSPLYMVSVHIINTTVISCSKM